MIVYKFSMATGRAQEVETWFGEDIDIVLLLLLC